MKKSYLWAGVAAVGVTVTAVAGYFIWKRQEKKAAIEKLATQIGPGSVIYRIMQQTGGIRTPPFVGA